MPDEAAIDKLVTETYEHCAKYLRARGRGPESELYRAARAVVFFRYYGGDDGWEKLSEAIGELENIVGRPEKEADLYPPPTWPPTPTPYRD
jgi:hypothetical protein